MTGDRSQLTNFVHKFLETVKFGNDQVAKIMGYGDYQIGNVTISRVYYVEGLGHNLFSVGQFCDSDLKVAFRKHTCFVHNLEGVDLLSGSQGTNMYSLSIGDMMTSSPICLLHGLVRGLPRLIFEKDHLCSACAMGKSKKQSHKPKFEDTNQEKLYLLHMDLYGPMHVASVNGKKYIFIIVDDYSQFTWVKFLASKDEAPDFTIKFLKMIQVRLNANVMNIHTDNGTEFANQTLQDYYEQLASLMKHWLHELHNKIVLLKGKIVRLLKPLLLHVRKPDLSYLYVFGALCYQNNDSENLGKLQAKAYIGLVPNPPPSAPFVPPSRHEWDLMFQPVFDEFFSPPASVSSLVPVEEAPTPVESTGLPSSTTVDQDAPSLKESHDLEVAYMSNDPYFGIPIPETISKKSSSSDFIPTNVHSDAPISKHLSKWTKDHSLQDIIGESSRPVSTRLQLHEQALFCYYDVFLTSVEPKKYKDALT
ncbi:retrovirus-related pol polyprotein from transposon TNT 1-94 [Tanacetum coccineum]